VGILSHGGRIRKLKTLDHCSSAGDISVIEPTHLSLWCDLDRPRASAHAAQEGWYNGHNIGSLRSWYGHFFYDHWLLRLFLTVLVPIELNARLYNRWVGGLHRTDGEGHIFKYGSIPTREMGQHNRLASPWQASRFSQQHAIHPLPCQMIPLHLLLRIVRVRILSFHHRIKLRKHAP